MRHEHKFFIFQIKSNFEPAPELGAGIYRMVEYAYLGCSCGEAIKNEVVNRIGKKTNENDDPDTRLVDK